MSEDIFKSKPSLCTTFVAHSSLGEAGVLDGFISQTLQLIFRNIHHPFLSSGKWVCCTVRSTRWLVWPTLSSGMCVCWNVFTLTPFSTVHSVTHPSLHPWGKRVYWNVFYFNSIFDSTRSLCYPPFPSERGCNEMLFTLAPFSTVHVDSVTHSSLGEGGVLKWCFL